MDINKIEINPEEKYPLPEREQKLLVEELLRSDAVLLVLGIILTVVATGISSGDWTWTLAYFGWGYRLGQALTLGENPVATLALALAFALVMAFVAILVERVMCSRSESFRKDTYEIRAGLNGELPRLPFATLVWLSLLVGFAEEFALRFGLIWVLTLFLEQFFDAQLSTLAAIGAAAVIFAVLHAQYSRIWERVFVASIAIVFGLLLVGTGSLVAVALSHSVYDFVGLMSERRKMVNEENYFGDAQPPVNVVGEMVDELSSRFGGDE